MASLPKEPPEDAKKQSFWMVRIIFMIKPMKTTTQGIAIQNRAPCVFVNVQLMLVQSSSARPVILLVISSPSFLLPAGELCAYGAPN